MSSPSGRLSSEHSRWLAGVAVALVILAVGALSVRSGEAERASAPSVRTMNGTSGADRLIGTLGVDHINGRGGPDFIVGKRGHDTLSGGPGNDRIRARDHQDRIDCGAGNDIAIVGRAEDGVYNCERLRPPSSKK